MINEISICLIHQDNLTTHATELQQEFLDALYDTIHGIRTQFNLTILNSDLEDYIKSFYSNESVREFLNTEFIDENKFYVLFSDILNSYFIEFLGFDLKSKVEGLYPTLDSNVKFVKIYYRSYLEIILKQTFLEEVVYNIFSNLSKSQIQSIESRLNKTIERTNSKAISKKYKIKNNNYILDLGNIFTSNKVLVDLFKNCKLITSRLKNSFYYEDDMETHYLYDIFILNSSLYEIESLLTNIFKYEDSIAIFLNSIVVYAVSQNFEVKVYNNNNNEVDDNVDIGSI